jgi:ribosomal protein S17E
MLDNVQEVLDEFKAYVIQQAKSNLTRMKKNSSKTLYNSIDGFVKKYKNSISIYFEMEDYGFYQDQGVSGTKKKYDTPYSYKSKMPPPSKLDKWIVRKGIAPRKQGGQFVSRKSLQFLIARSIYTNGIKPSLFFTKPFEAAFKKLPDELIEKYGLDVEQLFESITKDNFKK